MSKTDVQNISPRLRKVLASGKDFLIVTETEPYYMDVYRMIRKHEMTKGTWEGYDETVFSNILEERKESHPRDKESPCHN